MENEFTVVLSDPSIIQAICGTNDNNIKLIENYLGVSVFAKGNEISISTSDESLRQKFKFIIDRLSDEVSDNPFCGPEVIESILNNGISYSSIDDNFDLSRFSISIPSSNKKIYPKTKNQGKLVEAFRKNDLIFATGPAGSGKTFLAVAESLRLLLSHKVNSIILTRPIVEAGENLGFLPGALEDKINPYLRPLYDSMNLCINQEIVKKLTENGIIEVAPLAYMRGRTLNNAAVILDEAQNATCTQMKMFLTRLGENSKIFVTGDVTQIDLPKKIPSGLVEALKILKGIDGITIMQMEQTDVVRSPLVKRIVEAYENYTTEQ